MSVVAEAIKLAGGVAVVAASFGIKHPSVVRWKNRGRVPDERVAELSRLSGIPAAELRPDLAKLAALFSTSRPRRARKCA